MIDGMEVSERAFYNFLYNMTGSYSMEFYGSWDMAMTVRFLETTSSSYTILNNDSYFLIDSYLHGSGGWAATGNEWRSGIYAGNGYLTNRTPIETFLNESQLVGRYSRSTLTSGRIVSFADLKRGMRMGGADGNSYPILDGIQTGLDVVGLVPVVGEVADGINAIIYTCRGDYVNAGLSAAGMIPFLGWGATGGKFVKKGLNIYESSNSAFKAAKKANNIPVSSQPLKTFKIPDKNNPQKMLNVFEFKNAKGEIIHIRKDIPTPFQGPHFNAGPATKKLNQHYYYNP